jgi:hypothetical protein
MLRSSPLRSGSVRSMSGTVMSVNLVAGPKAEALKRRLRTLRIGDVRYRWTAELCWYRDGGLEYHRCVRVRAWGRGKNGQVLCADLVSTSDPGPWGSGVTDVAHPTPRDIRAIVDYALAHGWDPAVAGGRYELRTDADPPVPGFRITDHVLIG